MLKMENILIFEAHHDDCVIGMGGTSQYLHDKGFKNILFTVTKGETGFASKELKDRISDIRKAEGIAADRWINIDEHVHWEYGCQNVQNSREIFQDVVEIIRKYKPKYLFTHSNLDKHRDHRAISSIVEEAWWKATEGALADRGAPFRADKLLFFEVSDLFSKPNLVIDITQYYGNKIKAIHEFKSQFDVMKGIVNFNEGLAKVRGYYSNSEYGEAFLYSNFIPHKIL
jgi:LmbE family N-acetylglucosaminyl deacetylase